MNAEQLLRSKGLWGKFDDDNERYCQILEDIQEWVLGENELLPEISIQAAVNAFHSTFLVDPNLENIRIHFPDYTSDDEELAVDLVNELTDYYDYSDE